jgi:hypothetical protein
MRDYRRQKQNNQGSKTKEAPAQAYVPACVITSVLRKYFPGDRIMSKFPA